ncbi:hypothetical protein V5O48_013110 [Marasmius crinis-equi]|uniref:Uncharacterized protein n=1 Tax=Marasmius crinis-equi TaxID=585013 RepID=A0ABR3F1F1_9AGAR
MSTSTSTNPNPHAHLANQTQTQTPVASAAPPEYDATTNQPGQVNEYGAEHPQAPPGVSDPYRDTHSQPYPRSHTKHDPSPNVHAGIGIGAGPPPLPHSSGGRTGIGSSSMAGKAQRVVGELIGSHTMRDKGARKEREAMEGMELAEAERLEREAAVHRERAKVHAQGAYGQAGGGNI